MPRSGLDRPLWLAFDTGSPLISVALGRGGEVLASREVEVEHSSRQLLAMIGEVLEEAGVRPRDLAGIAALRGPGSFTGLRIGLATALGLHQALGIPAIALPSLEAIALTVTAPTLRAPAAASRVRPPAPPAAAAVRASGRLALEGGREARPAPSRVVLALVDALRGEWSAQAFAVNPEGGARPLGEAALVPARELPRQVLEALARARELSASANLETPRSVSGAGAPAPTPARERMRSTGEASPPATVRGVGGVSEVRGVGGVSGRDEPDLAASVAGFGASSLAAIFAEQSPANWRLVEPGALAAAVLRLAAAATPAAWDAAQLAAPFYARPPAVTFPKPRPRIVQAETAAPAGSPPEPTRPPLPATGREATGTDRGR